MKSTEHFKRTIQTYLEQCARYDELFAASYAKPEKKIDNCITYILNTVQKSGCNGFDDNEIYSMAIHYYDEDNIDTGNPIQANIVVNHAVVLTEEEKQQARKDAIQQVHNEAYNQLRKPKKESRHTVINNQTSLFDQ